MPEDGRPAPARFGTPAKTCVQSRLSCHLRRGPCFGALVVNKVKGTCGDPTRASLSLNECKKKWTSGTITPQEIVACQALSQTNNNK